MKRIAPVILIAVLLCAFISSSVFASSTPKDLANAVQSDALDPVLSFDRLWNRNERQSFASEGDGSFSLKVSEAEVFFPKTLDADTPIRIRTQLGAVKQYLVGSETYEAELRGRYLIYRGAKKSILYRFDSLRMELREFVYLPDAAALDAEGSAVSWRFEGGTLRAKADGSVEVVKKSDPLSEVRNLSDDVMASRISRFLKKRYGDQPGEEKILFVIPRPEYIDGVGDKYVYSSAQKAGSSNNIQYRIHKGTERSLNGEGDTLTLALNSASGGSPVFPIWADPSIQFNSDLSPVIINGETLQDELGFSVASAGDFNGDAKGDVIVGARLSDANGIDSGSAYIFFGGITGIKNDPNLEADVVIHGQDAGDELGYSVASAGDFNDDGKSDVIIGARFDDNNGFDSGSAFIFFGGRTGTFNAPDTQADVVLIGQSANDRFGKDVSSAGDFNDDGIDDVIVGAFADDNNGSLSGSAFIFFGGKTGTFNSPDTQAEVVLNGQSAGDQFGESVSSLGDFNGDGIDDVVVGAFGDDNNGSDSGSAFIFFGGKLGTFSNPDTEADVVLHGQSAGDGFGGDVAGAGDFSNDNKGDLIVGAAGNDNNGTSSGAAYIFFGGKLGTFNSPDTDADVVFYGKSDFDFFGASVASAGDFNGDGLSDVVVGAFRSDSNVVDAGSAYIFFGGKTGVFVDPELGADAVIHGLDVGDQLGFSVASAGDFNNDGLDDIIVGAFDDDNNGSSSGSAFIAFGRFSEVGDVQINALENGGSFGVSVASAGDFNGDGLGDVIIGARLDDNAAVDGGAAFIFFGGKAGESNDPDANADVVVNGSVIQGKLGGSVASAGDFNNDGKDDVVIGADFQDNNGNNSGAVYIFFGGRTGTFSDPDNQADVVILGESAPDQIGFSVASAGDFNGDGFDDVVLGAPGDGLNGAFSGTAYVVFGGITGTITDPDNQADVVIRGQKVLDQLGVSVSSAGDFNGDGFDDVVVGGRYDNNGRSNSGSAFIFFGQNPVGQIVMDAHVSADVTLNGQSAQDGFGDFVSSAGDFDGDGKGDVIVGARNDDNGGVSAGAAFVYLGGKVGTFNDPDTDAELVINGQDSFGRLGYSTANAGDVNGDGLSDVIVGAPFDDINGIDAGRAFVFYGGQFGTITNATAQANLVFEGQSAGDNFGLSVASAGDFNGDGNTDLIFGAPEDKVGGANPKGSVFISQGSSKGVFDLKVNATGTDDAFGYSVASAGDFNNDGFDDVIVGARLDDTAAVDGGSAYIFLGGITGQINLPNTEADVVVHGQNAGGRLGGSVSSAGDFNGDGFSDVIIGADFNDNNGSNSGNAYIFYGGAGVSGVFSDPDTQADIVFTGQGVDDQVGWSVASAGDFNGDGKSDVVIGAPGDPHGGIQSGSAYVFFGGLVGNVTNPDTQADVVVHGEDPFNQLGVSVAGAGDFNGDGLDDVVVGARYDNNGRIKSGAAFIFFGGRLGTFSSPTTEADVVLNGQGTNDFFGDWVAAAGDFNGDGKSDVVVGAALDDNNGKDNSGAAFVYFGGKLGTFNNPDTDADAVFNGQTSQDNFGRSAVSAGDLNGDGKSDLIVGAPKDDSNGNDAGRAFIFFGGNTGTFNNPDTQADFILEGPRTLSRFGFSVASAGDFDGNTLDDLVIGAWFDDLNGVKSGSSFVYFSRSTVPPPPNILTIVNLPAGVPNPVPSLGTVQMSFLAQDVLGSVLNHSWSVDCGGAISNGVFDNSLIQNPVWSAPQNLTGADIVCNLTVSVDNGPNGTLLTEIVGITVQTEPPELSITPLTNLSATGNFGGPFAPNSAVYTLTNIGVGSSSFTFASDVPWLSFDVSGAVVLAETAATTVTTSINASANTLAVGTHTGTITIDHIEGASDTTRTVTLTVVDATPPVITVLGANPASVDLGAVYSDAGATALDDVDGPVAVTTTGLPIDTSAVATFTVTYTATDSAGNIGTATRTVNVADTLAPTITAPAAITIEATGFTTTVTSGDIGGPATATDNVGVVSITFAPGVLNLGANTVTWTATDAAGNFATADQTVTVVDTTDPTVTAPPTASFEASGLSTPLTQVDYGTATGTDAVGPVTITDNAPAVFSLGLTTITWTATDGEGNFVTADQIISLQDTTAPTVTAPATASFEATGLATPLTQVDYGTATGTDAVGPVTITDNAPAVFSLGLTTITWTATDGEGNFTTADQTVTVVDTTGPAIAAPAAVTTEATGLTTPLTQLDYGTATGTDTVGPVTITNNAPAVFPLGLTVITWTATDGAGNSNSAPQNVTVQDATGPAITVLGANPATVNAGATYSDAGATALDLVDGAVAVVASGLPINTSIPGTFTVTYTATDSAGNTTSATRTVNVTDSTPPAILVLGDNPATVEVNGVYSDAGATAADDVDGPVPVTASGLPVPTSSLGTFTVTYTAVDSAGNATSATRTVNVVDTTPPVIVVAGANPATAEAGDPYVDAGASATDNVDGAVAVTVSGLPINTSIPATFTVTYTAVDSAGNATSATRTVNVVDTTPPVIVVAGANPVTAEAGAPYVDAGASATDNVDGAVAVTASGLPINTSVPATFTVTYTATDSSGNSATATRTVNVVDTTAPTITAPPDVIAPATGPLTNPPLGTPTVFDAVGPVTVTNDAPAAGFPPDSTTVVIWTATDGAGNSNTSTQNVTIELSEFDMRVWIEKARVHLHPSHPNKDDFKIYGVYELDPNSDGIDPLTEEVTVVFGDFTQVLPVGSFVRKDSKFVFQVGGNVSGLKKVEIRDDGRFKVYGKNLDLTGNDFSQPIDFGLTVGDDVGATTIPFDDKLRFKGEKHGHGHDDDDGDDGDDDDSDDDDSNDDDDSDDGKDKKHKHHGKHKGHHKNGHDHDHDHDGKDKHHDKHDKGHGHDHDGDDDDDDDDDDKNKKHKNYKKHGKHKGNGHGHDHDDDD